MNNTILTRLKNEGLLINNVNTWSLVLTDIFIALDSNHFSVLDDVLKEIQPKEVSELVMIGLLRSTFKFKDKLNNWDIFKEKAIIELLNRNEDPVVLLKGL